MRGSVGVHAAHCCKWHGCKYGDPDCPVANGEVEQEYPCEDYDKIMKAPFHWQFRVPFGANKDPEKRPGYYYWCEECWEKEKKK